MDTPDTALRGQNTTAGGRLYMAFELGEKIRVSPRWSPVVARRLADWRSIQPSSLKRKPPCLAISSPVLFS
jgi:hypothetical protein